MRERDHYLVFGVAGVAAAVALLAAPRVAEACGCLSPPEVTEGDFAVNQRAEQIIFEVEPGWVTAHVLIKYAGDPAAFAWIIPVPELPELAISPSSAFGVLDSLTAPDVTVTVDDVCPVSEWSCRYHAQPSCGFGGQGAGDDDGRAFQDAASGGGGGPPVTILGEQVVGDYQTVTFSASEAAAATQWLRDNGFVVNATTSIYMEPYVQANMVFVAAKLVPGAGADAIKPLRLRYRAAFPMIPLVLTAVAAEPHLTVTAFVYGARAFRPQGHPVVSIDPGRVAQDRAGRLNYPMVLARTIDEAGGDGFAIEYRGAPVRPDFGGNTACCGYGFDNCGLGGNLQCECPRDEFDAADCAAVGDIVDGVALVDALAARHAALTRLTTRVSPEEMLFDPAFEPDYNPPPAGRLVVRGTQPSLTACGGSVIDAPRFAELQAAQGCAALYRGAGSCVVTQAGPGCACTAGYVAQRFLDLDNQPSVTCVPEVPTCDLRAGGEQLPDACATTSCGSGSCLDRNGVAVCACDGGAGAIAGAGAAPWCEPIIRTTQTPGAQDYSEPLRDLAVCAPAAPSCGEGGWLVRTGSPRPGIDCGLAAPGPDRTREPPKPTCGFFFFGCGGCQGAPGAPVGALAVASLVLGLIVRRPRGGRARAR